MQQPLSVAFRVNCPSPLRVEQRVAALVQINHQRWSS